MLILMLSPLCADGSAARPVTQPTFSFNVYPGVNLPLGPDAALIGPGLAGSFGAEYSFGRLPLFLGIDGAYSGAGLERGGSAPMSGSITSYSAFAKAGLRFPVLPWLRLHTAGFIGAGYNILETDAVAYNAAAAAMGFGAMAGFEIPVTRSIALGLRAGYLSHSNTYPGVLFQAGTVITLQRTIRQPASPLKMEELRFDTVFPVFYKYYDGNPLGSAVLVNTGSQPLADITLRLDVPRFMDMARTQTISGLLGPGERRAVDLYALLNDELLKITEGTRVAASLEVTFTVDGEQRRFISEHSLDIADRNAMTWDDDRKAASFVTAKDATVLTLARNVAAAVRAAGFETVNLNLRTAIAMAETLALYGIRYVIDPSSPYADLADQPQQVDFLQFPRQTLEYRAGDCDDLSILYAALLEAVGIPTAFITIPGHIYMAFSAGIGPDEAQRVFSRADEIIIRGDTVWVPLEITILDQGFVQAWQIGAKQWRENVVREQAELWPLAEAWQLYPAVGLPDAEPRITLPGQQEISAVYRTQLVRFIDREIFPQVSRLQTQIAESNNNPRHVNRLGVLYASYGLNDRARTEFEKLAGGTPPFAPALVNLGNIHFLGKEFTKALDYYEKARSFTPDSPALLLALARTNHELENYGLVGQTYNRLKDLDPALAGRFAYLDFRGEEGRRAAQVAGMTSLVVWDE
jgi:tetratricopeptide (TPR) repeat protein